MGIGELANVHPKLTSDSGELYTDSTELMPDLER